MPGPGSKSTGGGGEIPLSPEEFAERVRGAHGVLWTIAAGVLGEASEAEDVLQEASMMALEKLDRFQRGTNFTAWMGSFVRNVALNDARKRRRRDLRAVTPESLGALAGDAGGIPPEEILAGGGGRVLPVNGRGELDEGAEAFDDRVLSALQLLGATQRACLLLRAVLDMSYREIAQALDIPEGTAMSHVHRARTALRGELGEPEGRDRGAGTTTTARAGRTRS